MNRRNFLQIGGLGLTGLTMGTLQAQNVRPVNKSVVWLWLSGGISHIETFDPKPNSPAEFRSTTGAITTNVPGIEFGATFGRLSRVADKLVIVRSFTHRNSGHGGGTHWVMTGYDHAQADSDGSQVRPGVGAIVSRYRGASAPNGLPTYVRSTSILGDGPSFLGASYAPFALGGEAQNNLVLRTNPTVAQDRRSLMREFDGFLREADRRGLAEALDNFEVQAHNLINSNARDAFDLSREAHTTLSAYGRSQIGSHLLAARRMAEAGVSFVTVSSGGWDMHDAIASGMRGRTPDLDQAVSAFIDDIYQRGLDEDVLLVISGEFGRTPRVNATGGRDHWPTLSTLALAGGGLRTGQVVGTSSARAEYPVARPVTPQDLMSTIFQFMEIPQELSYHDHTGRPVPMIQDGRPIREVF